MKKFITSVAVCAVLASAVPTSAATITPEETTAIDINLDSTKEGITNTALELFNKLEDVKNHWAESTIFKAIQRGYVVGYSDLTFKPNAQVSRAEFIKMVVAALEYDISNEPKGKWYDPYVSAAIKNNLITDAEYATGDYTTFMTRMEMAKLSVRAIGQTASSDAEYMYIATKNGLISGVGNGKLAENDTTTRASGVTIIERIITIKEGGTLPVDDAAVKAAEQAMNAPKDPWGSVIRTTNLPANANDYPYILEKWPNAMYELDLKSKNIRMTAKDIVELNQYDHIAVSNWAALINTWGQKILNVDYKSVEGQWGKTLMDVMLVQGNALENSTEKYINWVKKNRIVIEGTLQAEPSIVQFSDTTYFMRTYFKFRLMSFEVNKDLFDDINFEDNKFKKNTWYEGYADIMLMSNVHRGTWNDYKVAPSASIFKQGNIRELK